MIISLWTVPLVPVVLFGLSWLTAYWTLGRPPVPGADDPDRIPGVFPMLKAATELSMLLVFPIMYGLGSAAIREWGWNRRSVLIVSIGAVLALGMPFSIYSTPWSGAVWWAD